MPDRPGMGSPAPLCAGGPKASRSRLGAFLVLVEVSKAHDLR